MTLHDLHVWGAWFVIIANAAVGAWALAAHWLVPLRHRSLWWCTAVAQSAIFVQVGLGVAVQRVDGVEPEEFHEFYGFVALFTVAIVWSYRSQLRSHVYLLYGMGGLFLMGLGLRAVYLG